jgi:hypothetical protein
MQKKNKTQPAFILHFSMCFEKIKKNVSPSENYETLDRINKNIKLRDRALNAFIEYSTKISTARCRCVAAKMIIRRRTEGRKEGRTRWDAVARAGNYRIMCRFSSCPNS